MEAHAQFQTPKRSPLQSQSSGISSICRVQLPTTMKLSSDCKTGPTNTFLSSECKIGPSTVKILQRRRMALLDVISPKTKITTPGAATPGCKSAKSSVQRGGDRFVPNRSAMDMDFSQFELSRGKQRTSSTEASFPGKFNSPGINAYKQQLELAFDKVAAGPGDITASNSKVLAFKVKPPVPPKEFDNQARVMYSQEAARRFPSRKDYRQIPQAPEKVLDAPGVVDDFYTSIMDWSVENVLAVALGPAVYLWDANTEDSKELMSLEAEEGGAPAFVTSVSWAPDGTHLAVGISNSELHVWNTKSLKKVRSLAGHNVRVGTMDWKSSNLTTGGNDGIIINHDVRIKEHITSRLAAHEGEVCSVEWAPSGRHLASGGNDNFVHIWDSAMLPSVKKSLASDGAQNTSSSNSQWLHRLTDHVGAVKALAWCPFQSNLLATGGGASDRNIKFWNTQTGACLNSIDTESQVLDLLWSKIDYELLSAHGYNRNSLCLWKYPSLVKVAEITRHAGRVLKMVQSPDGSMVASISADETIAIWKVFREREKCATANGGRSSTLAPGLDSVTNGSSKGLSIR